MEKNELFGKLYSEALQEHLAALKLLLDPSWVLNPGKVLPAARSLGPHRDLVETH
jgi:FAD/FMN-containing dehydrogenase